MSDKPDKDPLNPERIRALVSEFLIPEDMMDLDRSALAGMSENDRQLTSILLELIDRYGYDDVNAWLEGGPAPWPEGEAPFAAADEWTLDHSIAWVDYAILSDEPLPAQPGDELRQSWKHIKTHIAELHDELGLDPIPEQQ